MIFLGEKLDKNHVFNFPGEYEERFYHIEDGIDLHGLLFRVKEADSGFLKAVLLIDISGFSAPSLS